MFPSISVPKFHFVITHNGDSVILSALCELFGQDTQLLYLCNLLSNDDGRFMSMIYIEI